MPSSDAAARVTVTEQDYRRARTALMGQTTDPISIDPVGLTWTSILASPEKAVALLNRVAAAEAALDSARRVLIKHAVIEEFDYPGDTPVSCGFHCLVCGALHGETAETVQHEEGCALPQPAHRVGEGT